MQLFDAKLDDFELRILDISDTINSAIVKHEFINTDGARLENLGLHAREINFKAYFFGGVTVSTRDASYYNHFSFIDTILVRSRAHTLIHPKYGTIMGYVQSASINHNDTQDYVEIDISFVQDLIQDRIVQNQQAIDSLVSAYQVQLLNSDISRMTNEIGSLGFSDCLGQIVKKGQSVLSQLKNISLATRNFVKDIDSGLNKLDSFLADVTEPVTSINAAVAYVGDLPSRVVGSITSATNRIGGMLSNLNNLPKALTNSYGYNVRQLTNSLGNLGLQSATSLWYQQHAMIIGSGNLAVLTAGLMATDQARNNLRRQKMARKSFDEKGRRIIGTAIPETLTSRDVEDMAYTSRTLSQDAITLIRAGANTSDNTIGLLKSQSEALIDYVSMVKLTKQQQLIVAVNNMPMHLLCLQLGLPYNSAELLLRVNPNIKNPTFCEGNVTAYVG